MDGTGDGFGGTAFAGGNHDEELHDSVIDLGAAALHNKNILVTDRGFDTD